MPVNVNKVIRKLGPAERKKVESRAAEIVAEELSSRDPRKAGKLTRAQRLVRKRVKPGTSLVDELITERREAARNE